MPFLKGKMSTSRAAEDDPPEGTAEREVVVEQSDDGNKRTVGVEDGGEEVLV